MHEQTRALLEQAVVSSMREHHYELANRITVLLQEFAPPLPAVQPTPPPEVRPILAAPPEPEVRRFYLRSVNGRGPGVFPDPVGDAADPNGYRSPVNWADLIEQKYMRYVREVRQQSRFTSHELMDWVERYIDLNDAELAKHKNGQPRWRKQLSGGLCLLVDQGKLFRLGDGAHTYSLDNPLPSINLAASV